MEHNELVFDIARDGLWSSPFSTFIFAAPVAGLFLLIVGPLIQSLIKQWPWLRVFAGLPESRSGLRLLGVGFLLAGPATYLLLSHFVAVKSNIIANGGCEWVEGSVEQIEEAKDITGLSRLTLHVGASALRLEPLQFDGSFSSSSRAIDTIQAGDRLRICIINTGIYRVERRRAAAL